MPLGVFDIRFTGKFYRILGICKNTQLENLSMATEVVRSLGSFIDSSLVQTLNNSEHRHHQLDVVVSVSFERVTLKANNR